MEILKRAGVDVPKIRCDPNGNGVLRSYSKESMLNIVEREINLLAHADDGGMLFNEREILIKGIRGTCGVMATWGLTLNAGHEDKKSKTELMLTPSTSTIVIERK